MTFDREKAAAVLVDAAYRGDEEAARLWGLSLRTIRNYRARLVEDDGLASLFQQKRALVDQSWVDRFPGMLGAGADFIERAARQGSPKDPAMVHAVAGAMKLMAEIIFVKQMLDARLNDGTAEQHRADRPKIAEMVAEDGEFTDADDGPGLDA